MAACLLISGCITSGQQDAIKITTTPQPIEIASPIPTATPMPPATPTPKATKVPTIKPTINTGSSADFAPGLPPAVIFNSIPKYGETGVLSGTITGVDTTKYKLAVFLNNGGWWNAPSADQPLTTINADGSWKCDITQSPASWYASDIDAFLVPAGFDVPIVTGRYGLPWQLKNASIACNEYTRQTN